LPCPWLEIHHTPRHGSWLNIAEIELSALTRQCLDRRINDLGQLNTELTAWQHAANTAQWSAPGSLEAVTSGKVGAHGIQEAASR
jgi:hypothetical protein